MLELRIKQGRRHVPIFDLPAYLGRAGAAQELGDTIEALIAFLDDLGGDPDLEETDAEDAFVPPANARAHAAGPGCPLSDPGEHNGRTPGFHGERSSSRSLEMWGV